LELQIISQAVGSSYTEDPESESRRSACYFPKIESILYQREKIDVNYGDVNLSPCATGVTKNAENCWLFNPGSLFSASSTSSIPG